MTVGRAAGGHIRLSGLCPIEDAEPLLRLLANDPAALVDWRGCEHAHAAIIQILLAARPKMLGPPGDLILEKHIAPLINGAEGQPIPR
jgi:hypothetical protein